MATEKQNILNKIALKYFRKAKDTLSNSILDELTDNWIGEIEKGNSNVSYDELKVLARYSDDACLSTEGAMKQLRCSYTKFRKIYSKKINRIKHKGVLNKVDIDIIDDELSSKTFK